MKILTVVLFVSLSSFSCSNVSTSSSSSSMTTWSSSADVLDSSLSFVSAPSVSLTVSTSSSSMTTSSSSADALDNSLSFMSAPSVTPTEEDYQDSEEYTGADRIDIGTDTLYSIVRTHAIWEDASHKCKSKGRNGRLASIDDAYTTNKLEPYVKNVGHVLWLGFQKGLSGTLIRTGNAQSSYTNWAAGEPNHLYKEYCVELLNWNMKWNDVQCEWARFYLCAYDKDPTSSSSSSVTSSSSSANVLDNSDPTSSSSSSGTSSSSSANVLNNSLSFMSAPSITLTDIAKESHANLIATSCLIVFVFLAFLAVLVVKRWPLPPKVISSDNETLL